jgi:hypothetical protein
MARLKGDISTCRIPVIALAELAGDGNRILDATKLGE